MLADLFNDEETYDPIPNPSYSTKKGSNCADELPEPEMPRGSSNFVGLYNQGATCYMNSALQILYMTPKFRNLINSLILCDKILGNPTLFIPQGQKYNIILTLQKLFSELNLMNLKATKTKELTEAFGWEKNEGGDQHDSQEFIRILLFDVLERILYDTPFNNIINNIYKVNYISNMQCNNCGNLKNKIESEYVLNLQILNMKGVYESLFSSFGFEEIIDDYHCEKCDKKVSLKKWSKIISLPNYINFGLNRFSYDYNTFERIKLNNKFEFPLELNMKQFCDISDKNIEKENDDDYLYELYGVIVHSGTPFSGHYYSYIRDMTGQGNWKLDEIPIVNENINNNKKEEKEEKNNNEETNEKKKGKKKNKKNKNKENSQQENKEKKDNENNNKNTINENEKDFPIPYENKSLKENWFEFNDTSVTSMPISRLEKVFKGKASAYMLFYSKKENSKEKIEILPPPDYLKNFMDEFNQKLEKDRLNYEQEKNSFVINFYSLINFELNKDECMVHLKEKNDVNFIVEKKYKFTDNISFFFEKENAIDKICFLFHVQNKENIKYVIIDKKITIEENKNMTLKDLEFYHYCNVIFVEKNNEIFDLNFIKIGKEYEPCLLKFFYDGIIFEIKTFGCYYIDELKNIIEKKIGMKKDDFDIYFKSGNKKIFLTDNTIIKKNSKEEKNLKDLNLENKNILYISPRDVTKNTSEQNPQSENNNISNINNPENIIDCIVKFEDDESTVQIIKINLEKTFLDLYQKIFEQFDIIREKTENTDTNNISIFDINNISFRLFNESENKIISKEYLDKKLNTSPVFIEGAPRLRIELGEIYNENEISLKILMNSISEENKQIEKEFICDPNKYTIFQVKKFLLDNIIESETKEEKEKLYENYLLYRTNLYNLPTKPIKLEKDLLANLGIKDRDVLFLQNILEIPNEIAYINIIFSNKELYHYDLGQNFEKINFEDFKEKLELKLPKKTTIKELKEKIIKEKEEINPDLLLIRVIGKFYQLERILKNDNYDLKKYNLESPINLFVEILKEPIFKEIQEQKNEIETKKAKKTKEKEKETLIILMQKNTKENFYENKKIFFIQNDPSFFGTKELYDLCRIHTGWMNISIAKYNKGNYTYEEIKEYDDNNKSLSLKKGNYALRDSDWITIINLDEENNFVTKYDSEQQNEIKKRKEELKKLKIKEKNSKKNYEKPLRIKLDD